MNREDLDAGCPCEYVHTCMRCGAIREAAEQDGCGDDVAALRQRCRYLEVALNRWLPEIAGADDTPMHEAASEDALLLMGAEVLAGECYGQQLWERMESAESLASQIATDWLPANERLSARAEAAERDKQHYMDEAAKWLDTAAKNWQVIERVRSLLAAWRDDAEKNGSAEWPSTAMQLACARELDAAIDKAIDTAREASGRDADDRLDRGKKG